MIKILAEALAQKNERPFRSNIPSSRPLVTCNYCHRSGHTIQECRTRQQSSRSQSSYGQSSSRFIEKYHHCGIPGHQERDYRRKVSEGSWHPNQSYERSSQQSNQNIEDLVKKVSHLAIANVMEQQKNPQSQGSETKKCYACNKFGHLASRCPTCWHDANALGEDLQESSSLDELFTAEEPEKNLIDFG